MVKMHIKRLMKIMKCYLCPRKCGVERTEHTPGGVCASPLLPMAARAAAHYGEEPCISGERGSGAVFFTGCNLKCVFCQNREISRGGGGKTLSVQELRDVFLRLQDENVHNINIVTGTHYTPAIAEALSMAKLKIPVVWNSSGYESVETLKMLEGLVQIYMPDLKYLDSALAALYSAAPDYPEAAVKAIAEMFRQRGNFELDDDGMLRSGVLVRHLILPGALDNSRAVIDYIAENYPGDEILFSLMSQYTPMPGIERYPELCRGITKEENDELIDYMTDKGIEYGYWQEPDSATGDMIPAFDLTGL